MVIMKINYNIWENLDNFYGSRDINFIEINYCIFNFDFIWNMNLESEIYVYF